MTHLLKNKIWKLLRCVLFDFLKTYIDLLGDYQISIGVNLYIDDQFTEKQAMQIIGMCTIFNNFDISEHNLDQTRLPFTTFT